jgi:hypothetical protein
VHRSFRWAICLLLAGSAGTSSLCRAQDLEPRRWTHLPIGTDVLGLGYAHSSGDLGFDPVLRIEDAEVETHTAALSYTRYFAFFERTARIDAILPVQSGHWDGLVDGVSRSVNRDGLADPVVRFSTLLTGAPPLAGREYLDYRKQHSVQTSVGAALELRLPLGEYQEDKLINLGQNRFVIGPQLGVLHTHGEWSYELTGSMYVYTDNDEFFGSNKLEQDPMYLVQAHAVKTFGQAFWFSVGMAYNWAGQSKVDDVAADDEKSNLLFGPSFGFRIGDSQSLRLAYIRTDTLTDVGADTDTFVLGWSYRF